MSQHDGRHHASSGRILRLALTANAVLLVVQVGGAMAFSSLALLADAGHQGSDVVALLIAVVAQALAGRAPSDNYTFGLRRAEVMGALLNAAMLLAVAAWVVVEASRRIGDPPDVSGWGVLVLGAAGLLVNGGCALATPPLRRSEPQRPGRHTPSDGRCRRLGGRRRSRSGGSALERRLGRLGGLVPDRRPAALDRGWAWSGEPPGSCWRARRRESTYANCRRSSPHTNMSTASTTSTCGPSTR